jgi:hypothetical protein
MEGAHRLITERFPARQSILEEAREVAIKEAIAYQIQQVMEKVKISKIELLDSLYNGNCDDSHCRHCPRCPRS